FNQEISPLLLSRFKDCQQSYIRRLQIFGMGESAIQQKILTEYPRWPAEIALGFRAGFPTLEVKLCAHRKEDLPLREVWEENLRRLLGSVIFGQEHDTLPSIVIHLLQKH